MKNKFIPFLPLLILIFAGLVYLILSRRPLSLDQYSQALVAKCSARSSPATCYDTEIPRLMDKLSMEDVFKVTSLVQQKDNSFGYCHVLGHKLASIETKKDPTKWKEVVGRCPAGVCSNGCVHGAFQQRYRLDVLSGEELENAEKELANICEAREGFNPSGLEQGSCYHALGHLLMYITGADINKSVLSCSEISLKPDGRDFTPVCYDGAFMQIFQPLEPEDISLVASIKQTKETAKSFCSQFKGEAMASCWTESWPLFFTEITNPQGLLSFCSFLGTGSEACVRDILYILPIQIQFDKEAMKDYCRALPGKYRGECFAMYASRVLEIDYGNIERAVGFCREVASLDGEGACFAELVKDSVFIFSPGSQQANQLCQALPEPWQSECFQKQ